MDKSIGKLKHTHTHTHIYYLVYHMPGWLSCLICLLAARAERMQHTVSSIRGVARARNRTCIGYTMAIRCVRECVYGEPVRQMRPSETERVNREPAPGRVSTRCRDSGVDSVCVLFCIADTKCDGECRGVNTHTHTHAHTSIDPMHCTASNWSNLQLFSV